MEERNKVLIRAFCIIVLIGLIISIIVHANNMSESHCVVKFITNYKNNKALANPDVIEVKVLDLYTSLKEDKCIIKWDNSLGYFRDG